LDHYSYCLGPAGVTDAGVTGAGVTDAGEDGIFEAVVVAAVAVDLGEEITLTKKKIKSALIIKIPAPIKTDFNILPALLDLGG
jgi:hypothetical protein